MAGSTESLTAAPQPRPTVARSGPGRFGLVNERVPSDNPHRALRLQRSFAAKRPQAEKPAIRQSGDRCADAVIGIPEAWRERLRVYPTGSPREYTEPSAFLRATSVDRALPPPSPGLGATPAPGRTVNAVERAHALLAPRRQSPDVRQERPYPRSAHEKMLISDLGSAARAH